MTKSKQGSRLSAAGDADAGSQRQLFNFSLHWLVVYVPTSTYIYIYMVVVVVVHANPPNKLPVVSMMDHKQDQCPVQ